jgi:hypothetical protein
VHSGQKSLPSGSRALHLEQVLEVEFGWMALIVDEDPLVAFDLALDLPHKVQRLDVFGHKRGTSLDGVLERAFEFLQKTYHRFPRELEAFPVE